ncbi:acyltransferase [Lutibacter sp.]
MFLLKINKVVIGEQFNTKGVPTLFIHHTAKVNIGTNFSMNNTILSNPIGRSYRCLFAIRDRATLRIGNHVGMSGTTIVCRKEIEIGNHVKIGGNVCIYDTDFHSLNPKERAVSKNDKTGTISKKITIKNNAFIGAHSTILKGGTIGENSIIGACSLISKDVPANEIWGGNPTKFIKKV